MGRDKNEQRKFDRVVKFRNATKGVADWGGVDPKAVLEAIAVVARTGGALRFGYTRDGGAYAIGVYGDGDPYTVYCKPSESVEDYLSDIASGFADLPKASGSA